MEKRTMTAATVVSTSCTQNVIQPYRRQALAAFFRFCRATSDTTSSSCRSAAAASAGDAALATTVGGRAAAGRAQALPLLLLPTPLLPRMLLLLLVPLVLGAECLRDALNPAPGAICDTIRRGRRRAPCPIAEHRDLGSVSISLLSRVEQRYSSLS